jgi:hypothetical protein
MSNIIYQIFENYIIDVMGFLSSNKIRKLEELESELKKKSDSLNAQLISTYCEIIDEAIFKDRAGREKKGYVAEHKGDKREIYTQFGNASFSRRYYRNKTDGTYSYLVDEVMGIESYDRVSDTVSATLVETASEVSYAKSSDYVCNGDISRQTVMNKIRRTKGLKTEAPEQKRRVRYLHVEADEDHVSLQDGTDTIVPLISIHEGVEGNGKRRKCINIHHIGGFGKRVEDIWQEAAEWIYSVYDAEEIEVIYLHGDGAAWIKTGLSYLPKAQFVLDRYHLNKALKEISGGDELVYVRLREAVNKADKESIRKICGELRRNACDEKARKKVNSFMNYITTNWSGIAAYQDEFSRDSNTEGHISHVLSSRLSSRPAGWSREGLKAMVELRVYCCNGGHVETKHIRKSEGFYKVTKKVLSKATKVYKDASRELIHNITLLNSGKVTLLTQTLRSIRDNGFAI